MYIIVILIITLLLTLLSKKNKKFIILPFMFLVIISCLRYGFGNDYFSYLKSFNLISKGLNVFTNEPLFNKLNAIMPNFQIMISFISSLYLILIYKLVVKNVNSKYYFFSIFILIFNPYIFLISLSNIRQTLAICLFIISIKFLKKRMLMPYMLIIVIASLIHNSAILLLPCYFFINNNKVTKKQIVITCCIVLCLLVSPNLLFSIIKKILSYFNNENYNSYFDKLIGSSIYSLVFALFNFIYLIFNIHGIEDDKIVYFKLYFISSVFGILAFRLNMLCRIQEYFEIFSVIVIPLIFEKNNAIKSYNLIKTNVKNNNKMLTFINRKCFPICYILMIIIKYISFNFDPTWESFLVYYII